MSPADIALVRGSNTFLLGTTHPDHGNDASHRGGAPGFVRVEDERTLWWPDYPGNNMFNSLGNLAVDPTAALLFVDFATGATLHLSGRAELDRSPIASADDVTGRRVRFTVEAVADGEAIPLRAVQDRPGDRDRGALASRST
jgi:predicted pyridoxine 5'-phosphate oxidase superfamily flavin-nucleotide-binding protein